MEKRTRYLPRTFRNAQPEVRMSDDGKSMVITGYGAVFYNPDDPGTEYRIMDDWRERIMPGAFDKALGEDDVRSFFNHDQNVVLGRRKVGSDKNTLTLSVDTVGLRYEVTLPGSRTDVFESVERGDVDGSSFMFWPTARLWREETIDDIVTDITEITEVRLCETGPVVFPAYDSATSETRFALDVADREAWKRSQRDGGEDTLALYRHQVDVDLFMLGIRK